MKRTNGKLYSVFLAVLVAGVILGGAIGFADSATPQTIQETVDGDRGSDGSYNVANSSGDVGPGATVFQGEANIALVASDGSEVNPENFERTSGPNEGASLTLPVPETQPTGIYEHVNNTTHTLTVRSPRIQDLDIIDEDGNDMAGGIVPDRPSIQLTIETEYNFEQVEPLNITVSDERGSDVTDEVLNESRIQTSPTGEVSIDFQEEALRVVEEYTVTVEGENDLNFDKGTQSTTITLGHYEPPAVDISPAEITHGETARFDIRNGLEDNTYLVSIAADDITGNAERVFRDVEDTVATARTDTGDALALIEINAGAGVGSINTSPLDTTDVAVTVYNATVVDNMTELQTVRSLDGLDTEDVETFETSGRGVELLNPAGTYVLGSKVTVNGTTSGVEDVALYARDARDFEYLMTLSANSGVFEEDGVILSAPDKGEVANATLSSPGTYQIALVAADDPALSANHRADQDPAAIRAAVGSQSRLRVTETGTTGEYVSINTVAGEAGQAFAVETNGTMTVSGVATHQSDDHTITVEIIDGPSAGMFGTNATKMVGTGGQWSVTFDTTGIKPGNYTVEASVGGKADSRRFQMVRDESGGKEPTNTPDTETPVNTLDTKTSAGTETLGENNLDTPVATDAQTTTEDGPGFTAVLALVALLVMTLLAVRHRG